MPTQTRVRKPTRARTPAQRLSALAPRLSGDNPILSAVLDMLEMARTGAPVPRGAALSGVYLRHVHGRFSHDELVRMHATLNSLSPEVRSKVALRAPRAALPIDLEAHRRQIDLRIARGIATGFRREVSTPSPGLPSPAGPVAAITHLDFDPGAFADLDPSIIKDLKLPTLPKQPMLEGIKPVAEAYTAGQTLVLRVTYPQLHAPAFKVVLSRNQAIEPGTQEWDDYAVIQPTVMGKASPYGTRLKIVLPQSMQLSGFIHVVVSSLGKQHISNRVPIKRIAVPETATVLASPVLTAVLPGNQARPGSKLIVQGMNLGHVRVVKQGSNAVGQPVPGKDFVSKGAFVLLTHVDTASADIKLPLTKIIPSTASKPGQSECMLPIDAIPGTYMLQLCIDQGVALSPEAYETGPHSLGSTFVVEPQKYSVQISQVKCHDESDPETVFAVGNPSDEIVAAFGGFADQDGFAKSTREIENFDDGDVGNFSPADAAVFPMAGGFGAVKVGLGLRFDLFESNESDVQQTQTAFSAIGSLATAVGAELLKLGQITAAAIAGIIAAVAEAIAALAPLFNSPDALGTQTRVWSAVELQKKTQNPSLSFTETLQFHNSDDDGSYDVVITVGRLA